MTAGDEDEEDPCSKLKLDQVKDFSSAGLRFKKETVFTTLYRKQIFRKWNLSVQSGWG